MNLDQTRPEPSGFGLLARDPTTSAAFPLAFSQLHLLINGFITNSIYNCPGGYPSLDRLSQSPYDGAETKGVQQWYI